MSTIVKSSDPCPLCLLQNKVQNMLENHPGQFYATCRAGHKFPDTDELNILRAQARAKYPNLYRGPEPPVPTDPALLAGQDIVITAEVKQTIEELLATGGSPVQITGGPDIKGLIFAYFQDNKDKDAEIKSLRATIAQMGRRSMPAKAGGSATGGLAPNQIIITLPEWAMEGGVAAQAEHAGMTVEDWVNQEVNGYFENYFSQAPQQR